MRTILVLCLIGLANAFPQGYQYPQPEGSQPDAAVLNRFVTDPDFSTMYLTRSEKKSEGPTTPMTDTQMAVLTVKQSELSTRVDTTPDKKVTQSKLSGSTCEPEWTSRQDTSSKAGYNYPVRTEKEDVNARFSDEAAENKEVVSSTDKPVTESMDTASEKPDDEDESMQTESTPTLEPSQLDEETEDVMKQFVFSAPSGERTDFAIGTSSRSGAEFIPDFGKLPLSGTTEPTALKVNRTIVKHFYIHEAPEFDDEEEYAQETATVSPTTHYNIVFVKAPSDSAKTIARTLAKTQNEQKTVIYVLVKKTGTEEIHHALKLSPPPTNKPQVYFIRYKTPEEAEHALNNIKNEYNLLGGENMYFNEGRAPVQSFIGKANKPSNQVSRPPAPTQSGRAPTGFRPSGPNTFGSGSFGPDAFDVGSFGSDSFGPDFSGPRQQVPRPQGPRPQGSRPQGSSQQGPRLQGSRPQGPDSFSSGSFGPGPNDSASFGSRFSGQEFSGSRPSNSFNQFGSGPKSSGFRPSGPASLGPNRQGPSPPRKSLRYLPPPIPQF